MSDWQGIETAPKDGTHILAWWWDDGIRSGDQAETYFSRRRARWETAVSVQNGFSWPVYWQNLPTPPVKL